MNVRLTGLRLSNLLLTGLAAWLVFTRLTAATQTGPSDWGRAVLSVALTLFLVTLALVFVWRVGKRWRWLGLAILLMDPLRSGGGLHKYWPFASASGAVQSLREAQPTPPLASLIGEWLAYSLWPALCLLALAQFSLVTSGRGRASINRWYSRSDTLGLAAGAAFGLLLAAHGWSRSVGLLELSGPGLESLGSETFVDLVTFRGPFILGLLTVALGFVILLLNARQPWAGADAPDRNRFGWAVWGGVLALTALLLNASVELASAFLWPGLQAIPAPRAYRLVGQAQMTLWQAGAFALPLGALMGLVRGNVDPTLRIEKTSLYGLGTAVVLFVFSGVGNAAHDLVQDRLGLPGLIGSALYGGVTALLLLPFRKRLARLARDWLPTQGAHAVRDQ